MTLFIIILVIAAVIAATELTKRHHRRLDSELEVIRTANEEPKVDLSDESTRESVSSLLADRYDAKMLDQLHRRAKHRSRRLTAQFEAFKDDDYRARARAKQELERVQVTERLLAGAVESQVRSDR